MSLTVAGPVPGIGTATVAVTVASTVDLTLTLNAFTTATNMTHSLNS